MTKRVSGRPSRRSAASSRREVAKAEAGGLPAELVQEMLREEGRGLSTAAEDNIVPLVRVLQTNSPEVSKRNPKYVEGAEAGHFYLKNMPVQIIPGEEGFDFQPCHVSRAIVEWVSRAAGGGFVARHEFRQGVPADEQMRALGASERPHPENPDKTVWVLPNGHELVDTRYVAGLVHGVVAEPVPFVLPLFSSGHTVFREWNFTMNQQRMERPGGGTFKPQIFAQMWRLRTKMRSNNVGQEWFVVDPGDFHWVPSRDLLEAGRALAGAFESGEKRAADDEGAGDGQDPADKEL